MKKKIRNRILAAAVFAASSLLLLSGFDSSLTVEEVNEKAAAALAQQSGLNCDVKGTADAAFNVSAGEETMSVPVSGTIDYTVQLTLDPFVMAVSGTMSGDASVMGIWAGLQIDAYLVQLEDGTGVVYARTPQEEDSGWHAAALQSDYMDSTIGALKSALAGDKEDAAAMMGIDFSQVQDMFGANAQLAPEAVNVNGADCYEITQTVDGDSLFEAVSAVADAYPQAGIDSSSLSAFQMLFTGIRLDAVTDIRVDDFTPVYAAVDLGQSDLSMIGQMFSAMMMTSDDGSETPEVSAEINALNLVISFGEAPDKIEIPAEALDAQIETSMSRDGASETAESLEIN